MVKLHPFEFFQSLKRVPKSGKVFLAVAISESIVVLVVQILILLNPGQNPNDREYAIIFFISLFFFLLFAFDGVLNENMGMIVAFALDALIVAGVSIFAFLNDSYFNDGKESNILAQMIISVICLLIYAALGWFIYLAFGWKIFMKVGHDKEMRARYKIYQVFVTLMKFDIQLGVVLVSMAGLFLLSGDPSELGLVIGAMLVTVVWAFVGWYGTLKENLNFLYFFYAMATVEPAYVIYKISWTFIYFDRFTNIPIRLIIAAVVIALLSRILLLVTNYRCISNFGQGLHSYIDRDTSFRKSNLFNTSSTASQLNVTNL